MPARDLVIVESPTKARTIRRFLGDGYTVESSQGHVRDLPEDKLGVEIEKGFKPTYIVIADREPILQRLRKLATEADTILLATDEDREGEAIAWHLAEVLKLDQAKTRRIVFHEITRSAIERAIATPRSIDMNLVNAQQARRILDRLVGYKLSPLVWRKVAGAPSAGRVQSVAVRLIVEREREIESFVPTVQYRLRARFRTAAGELVRAELDRRLDDAEATRAVLSNLIGATFTVESLQTKPGKKSPPPPFTTSTLQQEASRRFGMPIRVTMQIAQQLYESGYITYMRTDSVSLSEEALAAASDTIVALFGKRYHTRRQYQTKVANAQEAHEAIRPTDFSRRTLEGESRQMQQLYELIWKRALASQMSDAELERTIATIAPSRTEERFIAEGEVITFDGFLRLYSDQRDEDAENEDASESTLPSLAVGEQLSPEEIWARQTFSRPPARYTEASLVRKLEELGIGRPSTYATIIGRIQERGYVERRSTDGTTREIQVLRLRDGTIVEEKETETVGAERNKLFPTVIGNLVTDFLTEHFPDIVDYQFTATVEEQFDQIARGELYWQTMLESFYKPFEQRLGQVIATAPSVGRRMLGTDPQTGEDVYVGINRYQRFYVQRGDRFANIPSTEQLDELTMERALYYLQYPRVLGQHGGGEVLVAFNDRGAYIEWRTETARRFASIPAGVEPSSLELRDAVSLLEHAETDGRQRVQRARNIGTTLDGKSVSVGVGRYGPYVRIGDEFVSITPDQIETITLEQALRLLEEKRQQQEHRILRRFEENPKALIVQGKTKPYLQIGRKIYWLPDGANYEQLSLDECLAIATPAKSQRASRRKK
jgi:DNA topoisomerase-1